MRLVSRTTEVLAPAEPVKPRSAAQVARDAEIMRDQAIKDAEARAALDKINRAMAFERETEERERARVRQAETLKDKAEKRRIDTTEVRAFMNKAVPYVPLFLVNVAAITGQIGWALDHLEIGTPGTGLRWFAATMFGVTAESIALFLQYYANRALLNRDSAASLYLAAFLVAGLVAAVNFSHWSNPVEGMFFGKANATAVIFALCSFASPWLWRIHNRAEYREALRSAGEIDSRAVKLSMARKIMYPIRSFKVIRLAAWYGETNPVKAVEMYETQRVAKATVRAAEKSAKGSSPELGASVPAAGETSVSVAHGNGSAPSTRRDMTGHARWAEAVGIVQSMKDSGVRPTAEKVCAEMNLKNKSLPLAAIRYVRDGG